MNYSLQSRIWKNHLLSDKILKNLSKKFVDLKTYRNIAIRLWLQQKLWSLQLGTTAFLNMQRHLRILHAFLFYNYWLKSKPVSVGI